MLDLHKQQREEIVRLIATGARTYVVVGDAGVGKKTLVRTALQEAGFPVIYEYPKFGIDEARKIRQIVMRRNVDVRVFLIDGDAATVAAYNASLKMIEEPPVGCIFFIVASKPPIQTIISRCSYVIIPPFTNDELLQVLLYKGMGDRAASSLVPYAHGSVQEAMKVYERFEEKRRLLPFVKALYERDINFVMRQVRTIEQYDINIMIDMADEALLSRYGLSDHDVVGLLPVPVEVLFKIKEALLAGSIPSVCWLRAWFETA